MFGLIILIALIVLLYFLLNKELSRRFLELKKDYEYKNSEYLDLDSGNRELEERNSVLEKSAAQIIALYDITKDICKTLDEQKVFEIFRESINKYLTVEECKFLKTETQVNQYQGVIFPLIIQKNEIGYLAASGVKDQDKEKFYILAQQFLLGIKRAVLYRKVQELTIIDPLTNVYGRRYFLERFDEELKRAQDFKYVLSFLMVDIDRFKDFNDYYGHLVGDAILKHIAQIIKESVRQVDFIGRYGGEELSIVLTETDKEQARLASERIRQAIENRRIKVYDEELKVTVSIGIATFPKDAKAGIELIEKADQALYQAKQAGRNRVQTYTSPH